MSFPEAKTEKGPGEETFKQEPEENLGVPLSGPSVLSSRSNFSPVNGAFQGVRMEPADQPTVKISHTRAGPLAHHSLLICTATGYYPSGVRFRWLKNGQEQTEGAGYADEIHNGDWTFLNQAMLETVPQRGDLYACQVEHSSLKEPIAVQWEPRSSNSAQSKVWTGALGAVLGVVFGAAGVSFYLKTRRVAPTAPAVGLIG
ncbi:UNVERIFIED_CONTAM: hypothetical protein K2H54_066405 [Gekko kuhli]